MNRVRGFVQFLRESVEEFRRMTWPTREALWGGTLAVLWVSAFLTVFIWISDLFSSWLIRTLTGFMR